jgi:transcription-repair coupling factor (superfamily II helicase)
MEVAARDLDLRGAGDLIGKEQAGHATLIGLGLYQELFARAFALARGGKRRWGGTELQITSHGWVPEDYIPQAEIRLDLYHRVARSSTPAEIDQLADEIADRFGPPPPPVVALLEAAAARTLAVALKIKKISAGPKGIAVTFAPGTRPMATVLDSAPHPEADLQWHAERLILRKASATPEERLGLIRELLSRLE